MVKHADKADSKRSDDRRHRRHNVLNLRAASPQWTTVQIATFSCDLPYIFVCSSLGEASSFSPSHDSQRIFNNSIISLERVV